MYQWDSFRIALYLRATERGDYPRVVLKKILPLLHSSMSILDIGSGPGAFSLALAPHVQRVYAMDTNKTVLEQLTEIALEKGLKNIHTLCGTWPQDPAPKVDVIISTHSGPRVTASKPSLKKIAETASDRVFLVVSAQQFRTSFGSEELYFRSGIKIPECANHTVTLQLLEDLGIPCEKEHLTYDFGQPVVDLQEGENFLAAQLPSFSRTVLREHVRKIAVPQDDGLWLPNLRKSTLISFSAYNKRQGK
jgi:SAM-dependent methyltransferase